MGAGILDGLFSGERRLGLWLGKMVQRRQGAIVVALSFGWRGRSGRCGIGRVIRAIVR
jgi:hypothetical protein